MYTTRAARACPLGASATLEGYESSLVIDPACAPQMFVLDVALLGDQLALFFGFRPAADCFIALAFRFLRI